MARHDPASQGVPRVRVPPPPHPSSGARMRWPFWPLGRCPTGILPTFNFEGRGLRSRALAARVENRTPGWKTYPEDTLETFPTKGHTRAVPQKFPASSRHLRLRLLVSKASRDSWIITDPSRIKQAVDFIGLGDTSPSNRSFNDF